MKTVIEKPRPTTSETLNKDEVSQKENRVTTILKLTIFIAIGIGAIVVGIKIDPEQLRQQIQQFGIWASVAIFCLRFTSVIFPALPGTAYSIFAGSLLGFIPGLITICLADLCSCSLSFCLSRQYGRESIAKLVGDRFMKRVDRLSQKHLENNFFLMTGCLMTGFFDFVCYAVGLTKTPFKQFFLALVISIIVSNIPIVAMGAGILEGGKIMLGIAILGCLGLGTISYFLKRRQVL